MKTSLKTNPMKTIVLVTGEGCSRVPDGCVDYSRTDSRDYCPFFLPFLSGTMGRKEGLIRWTGRAPGRPDVFLHQVFNAPIRSSWTKEVRKGGVFRSSLGEERGNVGEQGQLLSSNVPESDCILANTLLVPWGCPFHHGVTRKIKWYLFHGDTDSCGLWNWHEHPHAFCHESLS